MDVPETRYAVTQDDVHIAFQVVGDGPVDAVFIPSFVSHIEVYWEQPSFERFIRSLSGFALVSFSSTNAAWGCPIGVVVAAHARGTDGDLRAVLDAAGSSERSSSGTATAGRSPRCSRPPTRSGCSDCCSGAGTFAPRGPRTIPGDCARNSSRSGRGSAPARDRARGVESRGDHALQWEGEALGHPGFVRGSCGPAERDQPRRLPNFIRICSHPRPSAFPAIQVPTRLAIRSSWPADAIEETRWTAAQIPGATIVTLEGQGEEMWLGDVDETVRAVHDFVDSIREEQEVFDRVLATVLFHRHRRSTERASELGDRAGSSSSNSTMRRRAHCSPASVVRRWTRQATGSSPRSTPVAPSAAPRDHARDGAARDAASALGSTPARSTRSPARRVGWPS